MRAPQNGVETAVDFGKELAGVRRDRHQFFEQAPHNGSNQCGTHAVPHNITNEQTGGGAGNSKDVKKISADRGCRQIAMRKAQRALFGGHPLGEGGILARKKNFLDFASHVEIGFELSVLSTQFLGVPAELFSKAFAFDRVPHGTSQQLAINLAFN